MARGYSVSPSIKTHPQFLPNEYVKKMNPDAYPSEVLYRGRIPLDLIEGTFAVRL